MPDMNASAEWDAWYAPFQVGWAARARQLVERVRDEYPGRLPPCRLLAARPQSGHMPEAVTIERLTLANAADVRWLSRALAHPQRQWFVARVCQHVTTLPEALFAPMMRAAIECHYSFHAAFLEPATKAFGTRRVCEHLLSVVASGTDAHKAGAVDAFYRVMRTEEYDESSNPDAALHNPFDDLWQRQKLLLLGCRGRLQAARNVEPAAT